MRGLPFLLVGALLQVPPSTLASERPQYRSTLFPGVATQTEVLSDSNGSLAYRTRVDTGDWRLPPGDAVLFDEGWWTPLRPLLRPLEEVPPRPPP